jgi:hypothetical protein
MNVRNAWMLVLVGVLAAQAPAEMEAADGPETKVDQLALAQALESGLVQVEYRLKHDKGEAPRYGAGLINEERPLEMSGFVLAGDVVLTADIKLHPRFIESITVRQGKDTVSATVDKVALNEDAVFLKLAKPLPAAKPLAFDATKPKPYFVVWQSRLDTVWSTHVRPHGDSVSLTQDGRKIAYVSKNAVLVDSSGVPVGMSMLGEVAPDDSWKGSPLTWKSITAAELAAKLAELEKSLDKALLRVKLTFRSPRKDTADARMSGPMGGDEGGGTQANVPGLLIDSKRVLVLTLLKPKQTARLETITLMMGEKEVPARFEASLTDYGAFTATLASPLEGAMKLGDKPVLASRRQLLLACDMRLQGENRVTYFEHTRFASFELGWRQQVYPEITQRDQFVFGMDGELLAAPVARREKVSEERSYYGRDSMDLTAAQYLGGVMAELAKNSDPSNVPLTEEEEARLAWLGVELQQLDRELARANKVSDLTRDGQTGALVSFVYPGSPAEKAGLKLGDVLLRLHVEGYPQPMEITVDRYGFADRAFPWHLLDRVSEADFDRIPRPWPPVESTFIRNLTDVGFGKKFEVELFRDGKTQRVAMTVELSPAHFDTAARYKSKPLGLTVADMTYETRRYFQKTDKDPGVIVSKIEPGSKASVAGLKPFEIITHVNDQPVTDSREFDKLTSGGEKELRLEVKRMTKGRVAIVRMDSARSQPASRPATAPADED